MVGNREDLDSRLRQFEFISDVDFEPIQYRIRRTRFYLKRIFVLNLPFRLGSTAVAARSVIQGCTRRAVEVSSIDKLSQSMNVEFIVPGIGCRSSWFSA